MLTLDAFQGLLNAYVSESVVRFKADTVGVSNLTYFVECVSGRRYVVRVIRLQTRESVRAEALIQRRLIGADIGSPRYLTDDAGNVVGSLDGQECTVAAEVFGQHPVEDTLELTGDIGRTLARMHNALDQAEIDVQFNSGQWLDPRNAAADAEHAPRGVRAALRRALAVASDVFDAGLPNAVVHGEFATNNLFATHDRVTVVFDWETLQYGPRILDLAFSWISAVYDGSLPPAQCRDALFDAYDDEATVKLTAAEHDTFPRAVTYVSGAAAAWCYRRGHNGYGSMFLHAGARYTLAVPRPEVPAVRPPRVV